MNNPKSVQTEHPASKKHAQTNILQLLATEIIPSVMEHRHSRPFRTTWSLNSLKLPDFKSANTDTPDLSVITHKLANGKYQNSSQCVADFDLMIQNCLKYNNQTDSVCKCARSIHSYFQSLMNKINHKEVVIGSSKTHVNPRPTLNRPLEMVNQILDTKNSEVTRHFMHPVDPLKFPDYNSIVTSPMDLTTIKKRAEAGKYLIMNDFLNDVRLILSNCYLYNIPGSDMYMLCTRLQNMFQKVIGTFANYQLIEHNYFKTIEMAVLEMQSKVDSMCARTGCSSKISTTVRAVKRKQTKPNDRPRPRSEPLRPPIEKKIVNKPRKRKSETVLEAPKLPRIDEDDPSTLFLPMNQPQKISWTGMKLSPPERTTEVRPRQPLPAKVKTERPRPTIMEKPSLLDTIMEMPKLMEPALPVITPEMRREWDRLRKIDHESRNSYNDKNSSDLMEQYDLFLLMEDELMENNFRQ